MNKWSPTTNPATYKAKFGTGDIITSTGKDRLWVYRDDYSVIKYTLYNLRTNEASYEPKQFIDATYTKIGYADIETIGTLYLL